MENKKTNIIGIIVLVVVVIAIVVGAYLYSASNKNSASKNSNGQLDAFAKCVTAKGLTMYGAYWCPHCQNEKAAFGSSFKYINYVECGYDSSKCVAKGVQGFPTWIDSAGKKYEGEQGIQGLSQITGCSVNGASAVFAATSTATSTNQ